MEKSPLTPEEQELIEKLNKAEDDYWDTLRALTSKASNRVNVALHLRYKYPSKQHFITRLPEDERKLLFSELVELATHLNNPNEHWAHQEILRLPRDWVLANIETVIEPMLEAYLEEAYQALVKLYESMNLFDKAVYWAKKAAEHEHEWVREFGVDWLEDHQDELD